MEQEKNSQYYELLIERDRLIGEMVLLQVQIQLINRRIDNENDQN